MKNKLVVMIVTFVIMILLTPFIFSKLMNAKYDTMLLKLSQNGYKIKTLKENIGYLKSERVLDVIVPGEKIKSNEIEYIESEIKTYFKNLPVTNVYFEGKIKDIKLKHPNKIIKDIAKKIEFNAVTSDFKTYAFSIKPIKYKNLSISTIKGILKPSSGILNFNTNVVFRDNNLTFYISDLNSFIEQKKDLFKEDSKFNLNLQILDKNATVKNIEIESLIDKSSLKFKLSFNKLLFSKIIEADNFFAQIKAYDFNKTLFKKALISKDKNLTLKLLANGFKVDVNSSLKNLLFLGFNQGGFNLNIKAIIYKADNIKDFENNFKKYLSVKINATLSKEFAKMLRQSFPMLRGFLNLPPDKNGNIHIRINLNKGSIK